MERWSYYRKDRHKCLFVCVEIEQIETNNAAEMERQKKDPKNERKGGSGTGYQMCVDAFTGVCVCVYDIYI